MDAYARGSKRFPGIIRNPEIISQDIDSILVAGILFWGAEVKRPGIEEIEPLPRFASVCALIGAAGIVLNFASVAWTLCGRLFGFFRLSIGLVFKSANEDFGVLPEEAQTDSSEIRVG